jgi:hypothetical protein
MTPRHLEILSRALLVLVGVLLVGCISIEHLRPDLAPAPVRPPIHFIFGYGALSLALLSFPRLRRADMLLVAVVQFAVIEAVRLYLGQPDAVGLLGADLAGLGAAFLPTELEYHRRLARTHRFISFAEIRANDRRRRASGDSPRRAFPGGSRADSRL